jgi:drug/metabolite transporter (DMT)-like permease
VPLDALALTLAAAVVHAGWNLLLAREDDPRAASVVALLIGVVLLAPVAAFGWRLDAAALPYVAASAGLEIAYLVLLATGYAVAPMSFVYPVARGSAPVLVAVLGAVALGAALPAGLVAGIALTAAGVVAVGDPRTPSRPRDVALALGTGACIAGYTLIDQRGLRHGSPVAYGEVVFALTAVGALAVHRARGVPARLPRPTPGIALAGAGFVGAYTLVLAALTLAPAAGVAAVRESSIVIGTALAALVLHERVTRLRLLGSCVIVAGVACVALAGG